jgi:trk system potassium uptake protein TrkH
MKSRLYVFHIIGMLCIAHSLTLLPPMLISLWFQDNEIRDFTITFLLLVLAGYLLWAPFRHQKIEIKRSDAFLIVSLFWMILSLVSAFPFIIGGHLDFVDALFEATSGFTTTGATVVPDLDVLPPSILYYRQQLQFFGGMGLVILAIAILPMLGVGGTQLYRAETPGPMKDEKLAPRLAQTARSICMIYIGLNLACAIAYWLAGVDAFDALQHAFATVSTGGFSTHDDSFAYFNSRVVNFIAVIFMLLGAINFGVHFLALKNRRPLLYLHDTEVRNFLKIVVVFVIFYTVSLCYTEDYMDPFHAFDHALFEVVSVITSTGFAVTDFSLWPSFLPVMLIFISFIGGCGGSTAGGIKVIRIITLVKQAAQQLFLLVHPKAYRPVMIGERVLDDSIIQAIWGFFAVYVIVFAMLTLLMMMAGLDQVSAFASVAATLNNLGPGLGEVSITFATVSDSGKLITVFAMLLGRLEIFPLLVILSRGFWRN